MDEAINHLVAVALNVHREARAIDDDNRQGFGARAVRSEHGARARIKVEAPNGAAVRRFAVSDFAA
jgi:hypothetical protein